MRLSFASYNIRKAVGLDRKRDPERIMAVLRELDADIIALQEADLRIGERAGVLSLAALDESPWQLAPLAQRPQSHGWHGNTLLVRRELGIAAAQPISLPAIEPRGAVAVEIGSGTANFRVIGVHLDLSGLRRRAQIRALLRHCQHSGPNVPTVILGDFNQWGRHTGAMREFGDDWQMLPTGPSFPSRKPVAMLDRMVTSGGWQCVAARVHHSPRAAIASDHLPIIAVLELPKI